MSLLTVLWYVMLYSIVRSSFGHPKLERIDFFKFIERSSFWSYNLTNIFLISTPFISQRALSVHFNSECMGMTLHYFVLHFWIFDDFERVSYTTDDALFRFRVEKESLLQNKKFPSSIYGDYCTFGECLTRFPQRQTFSDKNRNVKNVKNSDVTVFFRVFILETREWRGEHWVEKRVNASNISRKTETKCIFYLITKIGFKWKIIYYEKRVRGCI